MQPGYILSQLPNSCMQLHVCLEQVYKPGDARATNACIWTCMPAKHQARQHYSNTQATANQQPMYLDA